jgi:hypothetical protein
MPAIQPFRHAHKLFRFIEQSIRNSEWGETPGEPNPRFINRKERMDRKENRLSWSAEWLSGE